MRRTPDDLTYTAGDYLDYSFPQDSFTMDGSLVP